MPSLEILCGRYERDDGVLCGVYGFFYDPSCTLSVFFYVPDSDVCVSSCVQMSYCSINRSLKLHFLKSLVTFA